MKKSSVNSYLRWQNAPAEEVAVVSGNSQVLECEAAGSPPAEIYWLKDGEKVDKVSKGAILDRVKILAKVLF